MKRAFFVQALSIACTLFLIAGFSSSQVLATSLDLKTAGEFNGFILGDASVVGGDTEGRLAVQGNLDFTGTGGYSVGFGRLGTGDPQKDPVLDVGGATSGHIVVDGLSAIGSQSTVDYQAQDDYLKDRSSAWSGLAGNGAVYSQWGTLTLTGTAQGLNVFNVSADQWSSSHTKDINFAPGSRALINISGESVTNAGGLFLSSGDRENVLFNYFEATAVLHSGFLLEGSVLSPFADWQASGGGINGVGILKSLTGTNGFEFHDFEFNGQGTPDPVPEPGTLALLGLGCLGLARGLRRGEG